jgi:hypothetical protein
MGPIIFSSTYLAAKGKKGIIKPDKDGYYELIVGGLNIFNSAGSFYTADAASLFNNPSFIRRVQNGALKGEVGHPFNDCTGSAGSNGSCFVSQEDFLDRFLTIRETNVCAAHSKVWLDFDRIKDPSGRPVIAIMALTRPAGVHADVLRDSLNDPKQNTAFSVRGITEDRMVGNVRHRSLKTIVTFDYVNEPGISIANEWESPALESFYEKKVDSRDVLKLEKSMVVKNMATESYMMLNEISWIKDNDPIIANSKRPPHTKW